MIDMVGRIAAAVDIPVSADLESGYGDAGETVRRAIGVGIVGANLEDRMQPLPDAVAAVRAAVAAGEAEGVPFVLNARTDAFLRAGDRDPAEVLADAVERGRAFLAEGAACVFVPGKLDEAQVIALVEGWASGGCRRSASRAPCRRPAWPSSASPASPTARSPSAPRSPTSPTSPPTCSPAGSSPAASAPSTDPCAARSAAGLPATHERRQPHRADRGPGIRSRGPAAVRTPYSSAVTRPTARSRPGRVRGEASGCWACSASR
jgi:hypothetical protein